MMMEKSGDSLSQLVSGLKHVPLADIKQYMRAVKTVSQQISHQKDVLEAELYFQESQAPLQLSLLEQSQETIDKLLVQSKVEASAILTERKKTELQFSSEAAELMRKIKELSELEKTCAYFTALQTVSHISQRMTEAFRSADWTSLLKSFAELEELKVSVSSSVCKNFVSYVSEVHESWSAFLNSQLTNSVTEQLKKFGWPFDASQKIDVKSDSATKLFELCRIMSAVSKRRAENETLGPFDPTHPCVTLFLDPLVKRFKFHFSGDKKTNSIEKPEWFLTQILQWVKIHQDFLETKIQPILDEFGGVCVAVEFMRGLVGLAFEKVKDDLGEVKRDASLFSHLVDEVVVFEMEMRALGYPVTEPNCLEEFSEKSVLDLWIQMEHDCNTERVEQLLTNDTAWMDRYQQATDLDEYKVPECADEFLLLLQLITERYRLLRGVVSQYRFLTLQLSLLDDFRVRLVQLVRNAESPWVTPFPELMNAMAYIAFVLSEWNDLPFFIQVQGYKYTPQHHSELAREPSAESEDSEKSSESPKNVPERRFEGAFDSMINLFQLSWTQMQESYVESVREEASVTLELYKKEKWYSMGVEGERVQTTNITASFCEFLLHLRERLRFLKQKLSPICFQPLFRKVLSSISGLILEKIVMETSFTHSGAEQMHFDVVSALIPLSKSYDVEGVDSCFTELVESLTVLRLTRAHAVLLKDLVERAREEEIPGLGKDFQVYVLGRSQLGQLLRQRLDLKL